MFDSFYEIRVIHRFEDTFRFQKQELRRPNENKDVLYFRLKIIPYNVYIGMWIRCESWTIRPYPIKLHSNSVLGLIISQSHHSAAQFAQGPMRRPSGSFKEGNSGKTFLHSVVCIEEDRQTEEKHTWNKSIWFDLLMSFKPSVKSQCGKVIVEECNRLLLSPDLWPHDHSN